MTFKGHDYNTNHYRAVRSIEGFYPKRKPNRDLIVGRVALVLFIVVAVLIYIGQI